MDGPSTSPSASSPCLTTACWLALLRYLLCFTNQYGYGNWDKVKMALKRCDRFRFDYFLRSCSSENLGKRIEQLMRMAERENTEYEKKRSAMDESRRKVRREGVDAEAVGRGEGAGGGVKKGGTSERPWTSRRASQVGPKRWGKGGASSTRHQQQQQHKKPLVKIQDPLFEMAGWLVGLSVCLTVLLVWLGLHRPPSLPPPWWCLALPSQEWEERVGKTVIITA